MPKEKSPQDVIIKAKIQDFVTNNVQFLWNVPSAQAIQCTYRGMSPKSLADVHYQHSATHSFERQSTLLEMEPVVRSAHSTLQNTITLTKTRATYVLVYTCMLSDLDRVKQNDAMPLAIPVYCGLTGKSLSMDTMKALELHLRKKVGRERNPSSDPGVWWSNVSDVVNSNEHDVDPDIHQRQHTNAANDQHLDALNITLLTLQMTQKNSYINGVVSRWSRSVQN